jgi:hypothetical protein
MHKLQLVRATPVGDLQIEPSKSHLQVHLQKLEA